jgi:hypothetical protein
MPRDYLTEAVGYADERLVHITVFKAAGVKQTSMRSPLETLFNCITFHNPVSLNQLTKFFKKLKPSF